MAYISISKLGHLHYLYRKNLIQSMQKSRVLEELKNLGVYFQDEQMLKNTTLRTILQLITITLLQEHRKTLRNEISKRQRYLKSTYLPPISPVTENTKEDT